jgi:hypothetical protein
LGRKEHRRFKAEQFLQSKSQSRWSAFPIVTVASDRKEETVMKTDLVLTMDEYLKAWCVAPHDVNRPAKDARRVPITTRDEVDLDRREHGCRCDRWGHPCPNCVDKRNLQASPACHDFSAANNGGKQKWRT